MGFFEKLFGKNKSNKLSEKQQKNIERVIEVVEAKEEPIEQNENIVKLLELESKINALLEQQDYISRKQYAPLIKEYKDVFGFFDILQQGEMLKLFCDKYQISSGEIEKIMETFKHINQYIDKHNDEYIAFAMQENKDYLDNILKDVDPVVMLDDDQRKVIFTDEDYCLVVAGAGAGKTTTVAAKVKYLVEKKNIDSSQILVISFTNKAVNELKEKIQDALKIPCVISTFHSTGNTIINQYNTDEKLSIVEGGTLYRVIRDYFQNSIMHDSNLMNKLVMFFATYFDAPYEGDDINEFFRSIATGNFSTMRSELGDFQTEVIDARTRKKVTIQNEVVRSKDEVRIANFLYLNNIDYEYEPVYPYHIMEAGKPYTPDFLLKQNGKEVYYEHFGLSEDGKNSSFTPDEIEKYKLAAKNKVRHHLEHKTELIFTYSKYNDQRPLLDHLKEQLINAGFVLQPRSNEEIFQRLVNGDENRYIKKMIMLIQRFISNFKVNGYGVEEFNHMYHSTENVRSKLFLEICEDCYLEYNRWLKKNKSVDFEDMINESARILQNLKDTDQKLDYKYIIVDEYQDISRQRFNLTKALSSVTDAKIIAVGDDWQSIYAFSGSDITLFTKFSEAMGGYAKLLKIVRTYRNSQEVIDIAGNFIQQNKEQITKQLISPKHIEDPVIIYTYDGRLKKRNGNRKSGQNYAIAHAVEIALGQILEFEKKKAESEGREPNYTGKILLLGRFGFDGDKLERSGLFQYIHRSNKLKSEKYPKLDITFMTAHSSKGLGYDDVIIVNGKNETYGFPSKIQDDPVLSFVIKGDRSIDYAEERRLFYVAMTRTKNRVYFIAPEQNPSEFLLELKHNYRNVVLQGEWNEQQSSTLDVKKCPICGYPLQLRYKESYGLKLYICTNEPEICDFMTNDYRGGKLTIQKCDHCADGYLVVKQAANKGFFLGCTNYKSDGTGCNHTISQKVFYQTMGYHFDEDKMSNDKEQAEKKKVAPPQNQSKNPVQQMSEKNVVTAEDEAKTTHDKISQPQTDDYVQIQKAELPSVMYQNHELNDVVYTILNALQNVSETKYYGVTFLVEVLRGSSAKRLIAGGFVNIPEYSALNDLPKDTVKLMVEWLIKEKYILKTKEKYPVLHSTYQGLHYAETLTVNQLKHLKKELEENTQ